MTKNQILLTMFIKFNLAYNKLIILGLMLCQNYYIVFNNFSAKYVNS